MKAASIFGAGSWGTAIAYLLASQQRDVCLWGRDQIVVDEINQTHCNKDYLEKTILPQNVKATTNIEQAASFSGVWIIAVPSFALRRISEQLQPFCNTNTIVINLAKGLESDTLKTMSQVMAEVLPTALVYTLSGPSHAEEVGLDFPTSVVLAGEDIETGKQLQEIFKTKRFRPYLSQDLLGVEYAGTTKNVIALVSGIVDGLGFGDNAKGALISRGLAEMVRLGIVLGTQPETWFGLSGLGDLVTTCASQHSRNRFVGEQLGKGRSLDDIIESMNMVAEGVLATKTVYTLAKTHDIEMPITKACYEVLYENASPLEKLTELMTRQLKME